MRERERRRNARELALQGAYALGEDLIGDLERSAASLKEIEEGKASHSPELLQSLAASFQKHREQAIEILEQHLQMPFDQVETMHRVILVLAVVELLSEGDAPPAVVINEWVEVAKKFGSPGGYKLVNAVLDQAKGDLG